MIKENLFHKTIGILVNAYMNDTLEHTNCYACAVQNIVAGNMGYKIIPKPNGHYLGDCSQISVVIPNLRYENTLTANLDATVKGNALVELQSTGYSINDLVSIEYAFESIYRNDCIDKDDYVFKGLMSVVDCLAKIHEADLTETATAKQLFIPA